MNNNKFCINKSVFSIFIGVLSIFLLLALYQKIIGTVITQNNQAAVRKQTTNVCTYVAPFGMAGVSGPLSQLGIDYRNPPTSFQYLNINGTKNLVYDRQNHRLLGQTLYQGDVVSLIPADHITIPCQGEYLGNVWEQRFDEFAISYSLGGDFRNMSGFQNFISAERMEINLKTLCAEQYNYAYHTYQPQTFDQMGCNFITAAKTARVGGITTCSIYNSVKEAYTAFTSDPRPQEFKSYSVAVLGTITNCYNDNRTTTKCYKNIISGQTIDSKLAESVLCLGKEGKSF